MATMTARRLLASACGLMVIAGERGRRCGPGARRGARQGRGEPAGRAARSADRLRPGRRPQQDRRPPTDHLLGAEPGQHARGLGPRRARAADQDRERRRGPRDLGAAAVRAQRGAPRRDRLLDWRRPEPAGRHAHRHAAARPGRPAPRAGAGPADARRLRRRARRQHRAGQPPHRGPRAARRPRAGGTAGDAPGWRRARSWRCTRRTSPARAGWPTRSTPNSAEAPRASVDPGTVAVRVPEAYRGAVSDLLARLEALPVTVDAPARVVINERTGTVVVGANVRIGAAAVAHGNLSVRISTRFEVSQPAPFSNEGRDDGRAAAAAGRRRRRGAARRARGRHARWTPWCAPSTRWARRRATSSPSCRRSRPPAPCAPSSSSSERRAAHGPRP